MKRRTVLAGLGLAGVGGLAAPAIIRPAMGATVVGVTKTEIKIGHIVPYSGNASSYGVGGRSHSAFFKRVNDMGGVAGRKINFISLDDGYNPAKTVEQARRLVEQEQVAFLFNPLGTPTNTAIHRYMNQRKVPHLFLATSADKWGDYKAFPWTIGYAPSYRTEAQIYGKYIKQQRPNAKAALIYQNDDFGKDYLHGLQDVYGKDFDKTFIKVVTYEASDATVDSQVVTMKDSGAEVLVTGAIPKFSAQVIRKAFDIGWKPLHIMSNVSASIASTITPAGPEKAEGVITSQYLKDPTDPDFKDAPDMKEWREFMAKYLPDGDTTDANYVYAYSVATLMHIVLKQCGEDFSRENIMKQASNVKKVALPLLLPNMTAATTPTDFRPLKQLQLARWKKDTWERFGDIIGA
ncbi:MAG: ABC transporter substrate-binding protein [Alphaproteobacteria bacterium]|jgi:branched-chain amino acid transport system substrate-binding protein|nr:ABC transporter substrate-binding protein [Alphaproteobacteria bacterium]